MIGFLVAAALAAASPALNSPAQPAENADPAIFVVHDADTTVYIFGTFHALDSHAEWFNDQVKDAFESSDELVLETLIPEGPPKAVAGQNSAPPAALRMPVATSASFLATTRMAINAGKSQGMQVGNGADMVLRRIAEAQGKTVEGLESLQFQLSMFSRLPPAAPPATAKAGQAVNDASMEKLSKSMAEMQAAWKRGDQSVFVRMLSQVESSAPDTYRVMFTERNARWAQWISDRMQRPGTVFVAVGAGHLAGKDSVLVRLAERGIESARVN